MPEEFVFIVLFTFPGFMVQHILKKMRETSLPEASDYDKGVWGFFYSFIVFAINVLIMRVLDHKVDSISQIVDRIDHTQFLFKYICVTLVSVIICAVLLFGLKLVWKLTKNIFTHRIDGTIECSYPTVWENLRRSKIDFLPFNNMCVEIVKNGEVVTQGIIHIVAQANLTKKDILLTNIETIKIYLENDKKSPDEFKMFPYIIAEYYDAEFDFLVRFYDNEKWTKKYGNL